MESSRTEKDYERYMQICEYYEKEMVDNRWCNHSRYEELYREYCQAIHDYNKCADFKEPIPVLLSSDGYPMMDLSASIMTDRY